MSLSLGQMEKWTQGTDRCALSSLLESCSRGAALRCSSLCSSFQKTVSEVALCCPANPCGSAEHSRDGNALMMQWPVAQSRRWGGRALRVSHESVHQGGSALTALPALLLRYGQRKSSSALLRRRFHPVEGRHRAWRQCRLWRRGHRRSGAACRRSGGSSRSSSRCGGGWRRRPARSGRLVRRHHLERRCEVAPRLGHRIGPRRVEFRRGCGTLWSVG